VLVAKLSQRSQEFIGRHVETALTLHGSMTMAATDFGSTSPWNRRSKSASARSTTPPVRQREFGVVNLCREWSEALLVRHDLARERQRHERAAVKAAGKSDHRRALGVISGDLYRILEASAPEVRKIDFFGKSPGASEFRRSANRTYDSYDTT